jgi:hypothetical protein
MLIALFNKNNILMRKLLFIMAILSLLFLYACNKKVNHRTDYIDFEELVLPAGGVWNGSDGEGGFYSGNGFFVNSFDTTWQSWSGFAYTNHDDILTGDYSNQYSSIVGTGLDLSEKYAVYYFDGEKDTLVFNEPARILNISVSNTTYSYMVMKYGNDFSKKFGGVDGSDPDWFVLSLTGLNENNMEMGTVNLLLADFRNDLNGSDYILETWGSINLSDYGYLKSIVFEMSSSDTGDYGINTPAYVCIDNIIGEIIIED